MVTYLGLRMGIAFAILFSILSLAYGQEVDSTLWKIDIDDIVVTAQYAPTHSKNAIHKIKTISSKTIEARGVTSLENLLKYELNIRVNQDMILGSSMKMQGVSGQNIKVMIDGVPVIGRVGDNIDLSQISLQNIERVEIIEGPMSVNFGTNALGGVINLITKKSQLKKYNLNVYSKYESIKRLDFGAGIGVRIVPKMLLKLHAHFQEIQGFNYTDTLDEKHARTFVWNPKKNHNLGGMLRWDFKGDGQLIFRSNYFTEQVDNLGVKRRLSYKPYAFDEFYITNRYDNSLKFSSTFKEKYFFNTVLSLNNYERIKQRIRLDFDDDKITELNDEQDSIYYNAVVFRPVIASKYEDKPINFQVGLDLNFEEAEGKKIRDSLFRRDHYSAIGDYAIFTSINYKPIDNLVMQGGLRYTYNTKFSSPLIPSINVKYELTKKIRTRFSYAKGFRAPTIKELFYYFVDTNHYIVGNDGLKAEVSDNFQFSLDWDALRKNAHQMNVNLSLFYGDIQNKIDLYDYVVLNGEKIPAAQVDQISTEYTYFNQDRFKTIGSNVGLDYHYKNLQSKIGIAPIGRYNIAAQDVEGIPEFSFITETNFEISYGLPKLGLDFNFYLKNHDKILRYFSDEDDEGNVFTNFVEQDGYTFSDVSVTKKMFGKIISLTGGIKNLFDVKQLNISEGGSSGGHSGGRSTNISTGRNFFIVVKFNFDR